MSGRAAVALVARREISERALEKSFLVGTVVSLVVIVFIAALPSALGFGGRDEYTIAVADPAMQPVAEAAVPGAGAFDAEVRIAGGDADADVRLTDGGIRAQEKPDDMLVNLLQAANASVSSADALRDAGWAPSRRAGRSRPSRCACRPSSPSTRRPRTAAASRSSPCCCSTGS